jgi:hypothetical protein
LYGAWSVIAWERIEIGMDNSRGEMPLGANYTSPLALLLLHLLSSFDPVGAFAAL